LPTAHPDRRGAPAVPRRRPRPAGDRGSRRTAAAVARPVAQARVQGLRTARQGIRMNASRPVALACLAVACLLAVAACKREAEAPPQAPEPAPAAPVADAGGDGQVEAAEVTHPRLRVTTLDGTTYDLADRRGNWVVVNYWATWCGPCLEEMPDLSALDAMRDHVEVIGLAYEEIDPEAL